MKKAILYFLTILLIAALSTLAYGFWNAKNVRVWSKAAAEIKARHNISAKEKNIENFFAASSGKKNEELKNDMAGFQKELEKISSEIKAANQEIAALSAPFATKPIEKEIAEYYAKSDQQIKDLIGISGFMSQLFEVAAIFDRINQEATLGDIQTMISEAQSKSVSIDTATLPDDLEAFGADLKTATNNFLMDLGTVATGKTEDRNQLNASYADFSQKQSNFFSNAKKYTASFQEAEVADKKIDNNLLILSRIKFSIK